MAKTLQLLLAVLVLAGAAPSRAEENAAGEIVRSGATQDVVGDNPPDSASERDFDFSFRQEDFSSEIPRTQYDSNVRPASGDDDTTTTETKTGDIAKPRPLAPRSRTDSESATKQPLARPTESLINIGGSLCIVLSLFFGLAWITRRGMPKNLGKLPGEVIEVLGKTPLVKGQELQLVRVGAKLLLICVTPTGCETLTEIVDRSEVDRLSTICRSNGPSSMTAAFNQVLTGIGREPAAGFAGSARTSSDRRGGRAHA